MAVKTDLCAVCSKNDNIKYKCPSCRAPYCSVSCCKEHKSTGCSPENAEKSGIGKTEASDSATPPQRSKYYYETEDTVPVEKLELLRGSKKLKEVLENPHLRRIIEAIDKSQNAADLMSEAMKEPIFTELADECLRVINEEEVVDTDTDEELL